MSETTLQLVEYYQNLLELQYIGSPKASATIAAQVTPVIMPQLSVQAITFAPAPTSGTFILGYGPAFSSVIPYNVTAGQLQAILRQMASSFLDGGAASTIVFNTMLDGGHAGSTFTAFVDGGNAFGFGSLPDVVVTGSVAAGFTVTFYGVVPPAAALYVVSSSLADGPTPTVITITETDLTLPLAVQAGFNLTGADLAVGVQLDTLGKYVGVTRTGAGFTTPITLDDADFISLIRMAILRNNAQSDLGTIQGLLHLFFPDQVFAFDHQDMRMSFLISEVVGSQEMVQLFITEGLLPVPMAVGYIVIYAPVIDSFFGFRTYAAPGAINKPFNTYTTYHTDWPWLSYADAIVV